MKRSLYILSFFLCVLSITTANAQEQPNILTLPEGQALMHISATEQLEVAQDLLIGRLRFEAESLNANDVQSEINTKMAEALELANKHDTVKTRTLHYNIFKATRPRSKKEYWRGSQEIEVKSTDSDALLELVGDLQEIGFLSNSLRYTLSPAKADIVQDEMMEGALAKLQERAERAAKALGKSDAALIEINVNNNRVVPTADFQAMHRSAAVLESAQAMPAPSAQGGEALITMTVSAKALLKP